MAGRKIVWDPEKAAENLKKHHVSFDSAALYFLIHFAFSALMIQKITRPGNTGFKPWELLEMFIRNAKSKT
jgi:hypothetical protein